MGCTALREEVGAGTLATLNMPCYAPYTREIEVNVQAGARSLHPAGVNALNCDGSAGFIADDVDYLVWHEMHTRNQRAEARQ